MEELLRKIEHSLLHNIPCVFYRKPEENKVLHFFQEDDTLHRAINYTESGFVFAPFDSKQDTLLIPGETAIEYTLNMLAVAEKNTSKSPLDIPKTQKETHLRLVANGITEIKKGRIDKVVLSRKQPIQHINKKPSAIFEELLSSYPTAMVYLWYHPKVGLWMGATPETLLQADHRRFKTMSLAGTLPYTGTTEVIWGSKEKEEQQLVTSEIVKRLHHLTDTLNVTDTHTHRAGTLLHLKTNIQGNINSAITMKSLIHALHPTPAVCGLPRKTAKEFIEYHEDYKRTFYTGYLGELNLKTERLRSTTRRNIENLAYKTIKQNTHLFVNLRCMELIEDTAFLFVGGGVTLDSLPEAEWEETVSKLATMGKVLV